MQYFDVILVNPSWSKLGDGLEHLGLGYMAACLRQNNISVKIIDATIDRWPSKTTLQEVSGYSCKLIGVSIPFQEAAAEVLDFITSLRASGCTSHISVGGIYPSFSYKEIMELCPSIDSIAIGEGEETIVEMANCLINGTSLGEVKGLALRTGKDIIATGTRGLVEDLDALPLPSRDTLPQILKKLGFASMITSRGCYARCSFCSVVPFYSSYGPRYRMRSCESVMEEIDMLHAEFGVKNIMFNDANFIGGSENGKKRAADIAEEMLKRNLDLEFRIQCRANDVDEELFRLLKRAGLTRVYIGIESGSQSQLDRFRKDIKLEENYKSLEILGKLDLFVSMGFIMFDERINLNELSENNAFLKKSKSIIHPERMGYVYPLSKMLPLAGTDVEADMKNRNKYKGNTLNYTYDFDDPVVNTLYTTLNGCASIVWKLKSLTGTKANSDKNWTGGWRQRA